METIGHCLVCKTRVGGKIYLQPRDYLVTGRTFSIVQCEDCGFLFTSPRPSRAEIHKYYASSEYVSHTDKSRNFQEFVYQLVKRYMLQRKLRLLKKHTTANMNRILDYGCGTGSFIKLAQKAGFDVTGLEPSEGARKTASQKGLKVLSSDESVFTNHTETFDAVTLWHVLEHLHSFPGILDKFYTKLSDSGVLILALPMANSADAKQYGAYWAALDVPRHLYHFTPDTIVRVCNEKGFKLLQRRPLLFDSFYVSLLSDKNKKSRCATIKALYSGIVSNITAMLSPQPYSSEIFVFHKA